MKKLTNMVIVVSLVWTSIICEGCVRIEDKNEASEKNKRVVGTLSETGERAEKSQDFDINSFWLNPLKFPDKKQAKWKMLGKGTFGEVYEVEIINSLEAVKKISFEKFFDEALKEEMQKYNAFEKFLLGFKQKFFDSLDSTSLILENNYGFRYTDQASILNEVFYKALQLKNDLLKKSESLKTLKEEFKNEKENVLDKATSSIPTKEARDDKIVRKDPHLDIQILEDELLKIRKEYQEVQISYQLSLAIFKKFIQRINIEVNLSFYLSEKQRKNPSELVIFQNMKNCFVTKKLDVYIVMEKLGPNIREVQRPFVGNLSGSKYFTENIVFLLRLVLNAAEFSQYGVTHCDIKPENVLFGLNTKIPKLTIIDLGLATKGDNCPGGTLDYQSPEIVYPNYFQPYEIPNKFKTKIVHLADSYSIGLTIAALRTTFEEFESILNTKNELDKKLQKIEDEVNKKLDEKLQNEQKSPKETFEAKLKTDLNSKKQGFGENIQKDKGISMQKRILLAYKDFEASTRTILEKSEAKLTFKVSENGNSINLGDLLNEVIMKLVDGYYENRYPLTVAAYSLYKLHECAIEMKFELCLKIERMIKDDSEMQKELQISIDDDIVIQVSTVYVETLPKIFKLLKTNEEEKKGLLI
jgi:serine/threonine protein kinase